MRRRTILLMVALAGPFALAGFLVARQAFMPPEWQAGLDRYVAHKAASSGGAITVQRVERARKPWKFSRDMSGSVFGDGLYFRPDYTFDGEYVGGSGRRPLPFPPEEVWCVLLAQALQERDTGEATYSVVFVALHQDLYTADWVLHEVVDDLPAGALAESLAALECDLGWVGD
jgi:hypothetical protein